MASRLVAVAIDCQDSELMCTFWGRVLDRGRIRRWRDARGLQYVQLDGAAGEAALLFQPVPESKGAKNRVHLDVAPPPAGSQAAEIERLVELGAAVLDAAADLPWAVLADPEGNEFCVLPERAADAT